MPQELHIAPAGLFTDPSDETAPPGALLTANNIVIRRKGTAQPRPGFAYYKSLWDSKLTHRALPFDGGILLATSEPRVRWSNLEANIVLDEDANEVTFIDENFRGAQDKQNLYLVTADGIRKLAAAYDVEAMRAGAPRAGTLVYMTEAGGTAVLNAKGVRYKALTLRTDANDNVLRGTPSDHLYYINDVGATQDVTMRYYLVGDEVAGDITELYRTTEFAAAVYPDNEFQLCQEYTLLAADIANGYAVLVDVLPEAELGAYMYTNPSQGGLLQSNFRPPYATDVALFHNSMFYANSKLAYRKVLKIEQAASADIGVGAGIHATTGDTHTNTTIDNIADATGLEVGQAIAGAGIAAGTLVAAIAGTTVTTNIATTATAVGANLQFYDTVTLGKAGAYETFVNQGAAYFLAGYVIGTSSVYYAQSISQDESGTYPGTEAHIVLEKLDPSGDEFKIWGTNGASYFPILTGPTWSGTAFLFADATGIPAEQDTGVNWLSYSKALEPEAVPEVNREQIGDATRPIQRVIATKDALFIFKKGEGIFILTGAGAQSGWRVDPFDLSTWLQRPDSVIEMDGVVWAWTNKGAVMVSGAGVTRVSASAIGNLLHGIERDLWNRAGTIWGAFITPNQKDSEIILGVPSLKSQYLDYSKLYVFNTKTLAWYEWTMPGDVGEDGGTIRTYVMSNPDDSKLYSFTGYTTPKVHVERIADDYTDVSDSRYTVTLASVTGLSVVITAGSGWTPAVGDIVVKSSVIYMVVTVTDATHITVDLAGLTAGSVYAYAAFQSDIEWVAKTAKNPGLPKHYHHGAYVFADFSGIERATYKWTSSLSRTPTSMTETFTRTTGDISRTCRFPIPAAHARVSHLFPEIEIKQAGATWELTGLSLQFVPGGERGLSK